ncbi:MAG: phage tail protein [Bacteroidota bacterium]
MAGHIGPEQWVISRFFFELIIDGTQLSCQEITGLETTNKVIEYRHCDNDLFIVQKRLGLTETSELKITKGVFEDDEELTIIFNEIFDKNFMSTTDGRRDILVNLLNELGDVVMSWNFHNCIPTKLGGVTLKSDANEAAVEEITFVYEQMLTSL